MASTLRARALRLPVSCSALRRSLHSSCATNAAATGASTPAHSAAGAHGHSEPRAQGGYGGHSADSHGGHEEEHVRSHRTPASAAAADAHKLFSPPYDRRVSIGLVLFCVLGGATAVGSAVSYQQAKGGFWFKKKPAEH